MDLSKLSPLDHIKTFYLDSQAPLVASLQSQGIRDRSITKKSELLAAIQSSPVALSAAASAAAASGAPPQHKKGASQPSNSSLDDFFGGGSSERAEDLAAAASRKSLESLEDAYNAANKRCDGLQFALKDRELQIASLSARMKQLEAEKVFITASKVEASVMTGGHSLGSDPLTSPISASEASDEVDTSTIVGGGGTSSKNDHRLTSSPLENSNDEKNNGNDDDEEEEEEGDDELFNDDVDELTEGAAVDGSVGLGGKSSRGALAPPPTRAQLIALTMGLSTADTARFKVLRGQIKAARRRIAISDQRKQTMAYMTERLRRNADDFDRHLTGVMSALKASRKELADVVGYLRVLEASRDAVVDEVRTVELKMKRDSVQREEKLAQLVHDVQVARSSETQRLQREAVRKQIGAELRGDLSQEQEKQLLDALSSNEAAFAKLEIERRQREERGAALQEAYMKIKASTGVTSLNSLAQRFLSSNAQRLSLLKDKVDSEERLAAVKEEVEKARRDYNDLRASGASHGVNNNGGSSGGDDDDNNNDDEARSSLLSGTSLSMTTTRSDSHHNENKNDNSNKLQGASLVHHLISSMDIKRQEISVLSQVCERLSSIVENIRLSANSLEESLRSMQHLVPAASRSSSSTTTTTTTSINTIKGVSPSSSVYSSAIETMHKCEATLNVLVKLIGYSNISYLQKSVSSRATTLLSSDSNVPSRHAAHSVSLFAQGGNREPSEEKGAIIHPSSLSFVKKADILPDAEILSHFNALLSLPYSDGRPSLDFTTAKKKRGQGQDDVSSVEEKNDDNDVLKKKKEEEEEEEEEEERRFLLSAMSRNSDMSSLPTPGVARAMLDLCSTSSARMLSTTSLLNTSSNSAAADSHARSSNNSSSSSSSGVESSLSTLSSSSNRMPVLDMNVRVPTRVSSNNRRDQVRVSLPSRLGEREGVHAEGSSSSSSPTLDGDDGMMMSSTNGGGGSPPPSRGGGGGGEDGGQFSQSITANGPATPSSNSTSKSSSSSSSSLVLLLRPSLRDKEAEKESNKSMALTFAAEADPEGVLDRRILKKLASTMNTIEEKRKTAERESATSAKGKIDLQQAMARRASLARLMTSIATNADQAFAGTFKSSSSSSDLSSSSSSSTLDAGSSMLMMGSTDARPGLSIYTQKPRLR